MGGKKRCKKKGISKESKTPRRLRRRLRKKVGKKVRKKVWRIGRVQSQAELEGLNNRGELGGDNQDKINEVKEVVENFTADEVSKVVDEINNNVSGLTKGEWQGTEKGMYYKWKLAHDWVLTVTKAQDEDHPRTLILYYFKSNHGRTGKNRDEYREILKHRHRGDGIPSNGGYRLPSEGTEQGTDQEAQRRKRRRESQCQRRLRERQHQRELDSELEVDAVVELRGLATQGAQAGYNGKRGVVRELDLVDPRRVVVEVDDQELSFNRANLRRIA